jgi:predicted nucleic acid binding AN1-type Zn finger protein
MLSGQNLPVKMPGEVPGSKYSPAAVMGCVWNRREPMRRETCAKISSQSNRPAGSIAQPASGERQQKPALQNCRLQRLPYDQPAAKIRHTPKYSKEASVRSRGRLWQAVLVSAAVVAVVASSLMTAPPAAAWSQYEVVNANSALCLTIRGGGTANGTPVAQGNCIGAASQMWVYVTASSDFSEFNLYNPHSNKCLDTTANHADGVQMYIWVCSGLPSSNPNQIFLIQGSGCCYHTLSPVWDFSKCVEVWHSSYAVGEKVDHYTCNNTYTQKWYKWIG